MSSSLLIVALFSKQDPFPRSATAQQTKGSMSDVCRLTSAVSIPFAIRAWSVQQAVSTSIALSELSSLCDPLRARRRTTGTFVFNTSTISPHTCCCTSCPLLLAVMTEPLAQKFLQVQHESGESLRCRSRSLPPPTMSFGAQRCSAHIRPSSLFGRLGEQNVE